MSIKQIYPLCFYWKKGQGDPKPSERPEETNHGCHYKTEPGLSVYRIRIFQTDQSAYCGLDKAPVDCRKTKYDSNF